MRWRLLKLKQGNEMCKYKIAVYIETTANHYIGDVECDSIKEYKEKSAELWESKDYEYPTTNCSNDFDLGDWDISDLSEDDLKFYKKN